MDLTELTLVLQQKLRYMGLSYQEAHTFNGQHHPSTGRLGYRTQHQFSDPIFARSYGDYFGYRLIKGYEKAAELGIVKEMIPMKMLDDNTVCEGFECFIDGKVEYRMAGTYINGYPHGEFTVWKDDKVVFVGTIYSKLEQGNQIKFSLATRHVEQENEIDELVKRLNAL